MVSLLLEAEADKDKTDNDGEAPLSIALRENYTEIARMLKDAQTL